jgi:hypothetical protein
MTGSPYLPRRPVALALGYGDEWDELRVKCRKKVDSGVDCYRRAFKSKRLRFFARNVRYSDEQEQCLSAR